MAKIKTRITLKEFEAKRPSNYAEMISHADDYIMECLIKKYFEQNKNKVVNMVAV